MIIDFRSDTVTKPTPAMLEAMYAAQVGDDVFGEDPTVNELEKHAAALFGMESALFCPSGTMSNQIAIKAHTQPGDEVICEHQSHIYLYEGGGIAFNAGCQVQLVKGDRGRMTASQLQEVWHAEDVHKPIPRLVSLENTANRGGGSCYTLHTLADMSTVCRAHGLSLHLDGARLFNAIVAMKQEPADFGRLFDSISICLNKGLGCPMGSILIGNASFIHKARRIRKVFGGGMRQAGYMAACGLYALTNHVERLDKDHQHAQTIATELAKKEFCKTVLPVETNIIMIETASPYTAPGLASEWEKKGIRCIAMSDKLLRMVLHLDITEQMVDHTCTIIKGMR